jgi:hypothetical protein
VNRESHLRLVPKTPKPRRGGRREALRQYRDSLPYGALLYSDRVSLFNRGYGIIFTRYFDEDGYRIKLGHFLLRFWFYGPGRYSAGDGPSTGLDLDAKGDRLPEKRFIRNLEAMQESFLVDGPLFKKALEAALEARIAKTKIMLAKFVAQSGQTEEADERVCEWATYFLKIKRAMANQVNPTGERHD